MRCENTNKLVCCPGRGRTRNDGVFIPSTRLQTRAAEELTCSTNVEISGGTSSPLTDAAFANPQNSPERLQRSKSSATVTRNSELGMLQSKNENASRCSRSLPSN